MAVKNAPRSSSTFIKIYERLILLKNFFLSQTNEIRNSRALTFYGAAICLGYLYFWSYLLSYDFDFKLSHSDEAICWPFFWSCDLFRFLSPFDWKCVFLFLSAASIFNLFLFIRQKINSAYLLIMLLECSRIIIIFLDYRTRLNQNYMFFFIVFAFLFLHRKLVVLPRLLVLFYFWAGFLKLNPEWLTGNAIYGKLLFIQESWKPALAHFVVILEILIVPMLLINKKTITYMVLGCLVVFHLTSLTVVGFFYPALMITLLSIFPLMEYFSTPNQKTNVSFINNFSGNVFLLAFSLLNFYPHFIPGDKSITGETRLVSLHMFDSITYCTPWATIKYEFDAPKVQSLYMPNVIRIRCDPIVYLSRLRKICRDNEKNPKFEDIDFVLDVKRINSNNPIRVMDIKNFCSKNLQYNIWGRNHWINFE